MDDEWSPKTPAALSQDRTVGPATRGRSLINTGELTWADHQKSWCQIELINKVGDWTMKNLGFHIILRTNHIEGIYIYIKIILFIYIENSSQWADWFASCLLFAILGVLKMSCIDGSPNKQRQRWFPKKQLQGLPFVWNNLDLCDMFLLTENVRKKGSFLQNRWVKLTNH